MRELDHMPSQRANSLGFAIRPEHKYLEIRYSVDLIVNFIVKNFHSYKNLLTFDTNSAHKVPASQSGAESARILALPFIDLFIRFLKPNFMVNGFIGALKWQAVAS